MYVFENVVNQLLVIQLVDGVNDSINHPRKVI
jgi:hypothetical protein